MCFSLRSSFPILVLTWLLLAATRGSAQTCPGGPSDPNITGASGSVTASGGSCVYVSPTGAVTGQVRTSGTYTVTNEGTVTNLGGYGIRDTTSDTTVVNDGTVDARFGIDLRARSRVVNDGAIDATFHGIRARNDAEVIHRGTLDTGRIGILVNHDSAVTSLGRITSGFHGIRVLDRSRVDSRSAIDAGRYGIYGRHDSEVVTSGGIRSGWDGIRLLDRGVVQSAASIDSGRRGIFVRDDGRLENQGRVRSVLRGLEVRDDNTVVNRGDVESSTQQGIYGRWRNTVVNRGSASGTLGIDFQRGDNHVVNSGRVVGTSGTAIRFNRGTNTLRLQTGSRVVGTIQGGTQQDSLFLEGSGRYDGQVLAFESLRRRGPGRWTLGGMSTIAGPARVSGGTLQVDGALGATSFAIDRAGILAGFGTVVSDIDVAGAVAPGTDGQVGTLTVQGDARFGRTSRLLVDVNPRSGDRLAVRGAARVKGGTIVVNPSAGSYQAGQSYDVVVASGGRTGRFAATETLNSPVLRFETSPLRDRVRLTLERLPYAGLPGLTPNQTAVASALDRVVAGGGSAGSGVSGKLDFLSEPEIAGAMTMLDPEPFDAYPQLTDHWTKLRFDTIARRLRDADRRPAAEVASSADGTEISREETSAEPHDPLPAVSQPPPWWGPVRRPGVWAEGLGLFGDKGSSRDVTGYDFDGAGVILGGDLPLSERMRLGAAVTWQDTDLGFDRPGARGRVEHRGLAVYAGFDPEGPLFADVAVQHLWNDYETARRIQFPGVSRRATSTHEGRVLAAEGSVGLRAEWNGVELEPRVGLRYSRLSQDGFTEEGAGDLGLHVHGRRNQAAASFVGLRVARSFRPVEGDVEIVPELRGEWSHHWLDANRTLSAEFAGLGGETFDVRTDHRSSAAGSVGIGLMGYVGETVEVGLHYDFQRGRHDLRSHSVTGGVTWRF